jgi:hypothetical protein
MIACIATSFDPVSSSMRWTMINMSVPGRTSRADETGTHPGLGGVPVGQVLLGLQKHALGRDRRSLINSSVAALDDHDVGAVAYDNAAQNCRC